MDIYTLEALEQAIHRNATKEQLTCTKKKYTPISKDKNNNTNTNNNDANTGVTATATVSATVYEYEYDGLLVDCLGYSERNTHAIYESIETSRKCGMPFAQFVYGLGLRHVGLGTAKLIAEHFQDFYVFWELVNDAGRGQLSVECVYGCMYMYVYEYMYIILGMYSLK